MRLVAAFAWAALAALPLWAQTTAAEPQAPGASQALMAGPAAAASAAEAAEGLTQTVAANPQALRPFLQRFEARNPGMRVHVLNLPMNAYVNTSEAPGLELTQMWVGPAGTLVELKGLPLPGQPQSAVMRWDTLALVHGGGQSAAREMEGARQLRDSRGGTALAIAAGDRVLVEFEPVDDFSKPISLQHTLPSGRVFVYFEGIDPRFRERYDKAWAAAMAQPVNPQAMQQFLEGFAGRDPDGRVPTVFMRLVNAMRAQQSFEGYYHAYLLLQDPADASRASALARTDAHRARMEHMAVATLEDKNRLLDFDLQWTPTSTQRSEGSCWMMCNYNFSAHRALQGVAVVKPRSNSPIRLKVGSYKVVLEARVELPRRTVQASSFLGSYDRTETLAFTRSLTLKLSPPLYEAREAFDLGRLELAFFQRGSAGGYSGAWATSDARVSVRLKSVELLP